MSPSKKLKIRAALELFVMVLLFGLGLNLSSQFRYVSDWTGSYHHSLSEPSKLVLKELSKPLLATAYLSERHPQKAQIKALIERYQRHHSAFELRFVDPAKDPQAVRSDEIHDGEVVLEYENRQERISKYTELALTSALARLARNEQRWLVFVSGHAERDPQRGANHDISDWASVLSARGLKVQTLNLSQVNAIPENTSVVIIASPQLAYLPGEVSLLKHHLEEGGNLLWLMEPDGDESLSSLASALGIEKIPGTVVDPVSLANGLDNPAFLLATSYPAHPALQEFNLTTLFIYANAIAKRPTSSWTTTALVMSSKNAWSETAPLEGNVALDENQDYPGPLVVAMALQREQAGVEQRVIVVGDGDILSNTYLQNGGNQDFGVRLIEWLARDAHLLKLPSRTARDTTLSFATWQKAVIGFGFLFFLPAALAINGLVIWTRRRRA